MGEANQNGLRRGKAGLALPVLRTLLKHQRAFAGDPNLARPRPDFTRLREPRPKLRAIVTHPPETGGEAGAESITGAVWTASRRVQQAWIRL